MCIPLQVLGVLFADIHTTAIRHTDGNVRYMYVVVYLHMMHLLVT